MEKMRHGGDEREECCVVPATENREGGGAPVTFERGEVGNAAYPELGCSNGVVDEVCEVVAELWAWWSRLRCCDGRARAQRSNGGDCVSVLRPERARGKKEGLEAAAAHRGALRPLVT
jgi:hypothetical protein